MCNLWLSSFLLCFFPVYVCVCVCVSACLYVCVYGLHLGSFYSYRKGAQFSYYYISGFGETLSYNGLRQIGLISLKWGFLFEVSPVDSKQRIPFGGSGAVYGILVLGQGCSSFNQYNLQDRITWLISYLTLYWGEW